MQSSNGIYFRRKAKIIVNRALESKRDVEIWKRARLKDRLRAGEEPE